MKAEQGKISMRLFKKEKIRPRKKSIVVVAEQSIQKEVTNQLEVLFDPVFSYQINQRLSVFFLRWQTVLSNYPIKTAFYHTNDIGFITLYISFGVNDLLDDIEIKYFFQTIQELLTEPYATGNPIEAVESVFPLTPEQTQSKQTILAEQDTVIENLQDKLLEQDKIFKQWSDNQDIGQQALMEQLDAIEQENKLLQQNLDRIQKGEYEPLKKQEVPVFKGALTHNQSYQGHQSNEYQQRFNMLSQELDKANKLINDLEQNNSVLSSTLEQISETKNILSLKEGQQSKEISNLKEKLAHLNNENMQLQEDIKKEQSEKISFFEQLQSDAKELEATIIRQEQQLVMASTTEFKMQATIDELIKEKAEQNSLIQELRLEKDTLQNKLDNTIVEKDNILEKIEEQKQSYWDLEKKLKGWIEKSQRAEASLEEERNRLQVHDSSMSNDVENLRDLNQKLNEENIYYQNEMRRLLKEVNRLSDRVAYLRQFVDQTLVEEQDEKIEEILQVTEDEEKRKKRYDEDRILKLFQKADDAEALDVKVPVEEYREYRLSLKFLEYRWYQANIMQVNATGESKLVWSEIYVSKAGEFFQNLENLVKIPLLSKKYVIMDKEVLLRLKAYQALSDYLERRYFKSSKHIFDRETNE